jgi:hypothetical protein
MTTIQCASCWTGFELSRGRGRPRTRCLNCSPPQGIRACSQCGAETRRRLCDDCTSECIDWIAANPRPKSAVPRQIAVCTICQKGFLPSRSTQRTCAAKSCKSKACRQTRRNKLITCQECWREKFVIIGGGHGIGRFCGRACAYEHRSRISRERAALERMGERARAESQAMARIERERQSVQKREAIRSERLARRHEVVCKGCKSTFILIGPMRRRVYCSENCCASTERAIATRRNYRKRYKRAGRDLLTNEYIVGLLTKHTPMPADSIPDALIEAKRAHIKLKRFIKETE